MLDRVNTTYRDKHRLVPRCSLLTTPHNQPDVEHWNQNVTPDFAGQSAETSPARSATQSTEPEPCTSRLLTIPMEIQVMIWELTYAGQVHTVVFFQGQNPSQSYIKPAAVPVFLQLNRQTREQAQYIWQRFPVQRTDPDHHNNRSSEYRWFIPKRDFLFFPRGVDREFGPLIRGFTTIVIPVGDYRLFPPPITSTLSTRKGPLTIWFVHAELVCQPQQHKHCTKAISLASPHPTTPTPLSPTHKIASRWKAAMEKRVTQSLCPHVRFGEMPLCCNCPGVLEEMQKRYKSKWRREAKKKRIEERKKVELEGSIEGYRSRLRYQKLQADGRNPGGK